MLSAPSKSYVAVKTVIVLIVAGYACYFFIKTSQHARQAVASAPVQPVRGEPIVAAAPDVRPVSLVEPAKGTPIATPVVAAVAPSTNPVQAEKADGYVSITFDKLAAFNFDMPDESKGPQKADDAAKTGGQIPSDIRALNNKRIALKGFMLPLKVEGGLITEMLIMRNQSMCCYGSTPRINEWVNVKMSGKGVKPIMDQVITLFGTIKVGEIRENGYLVGIYDMVGDKMAGPEDL